jgi:nucleoside-diphosphate-sugar epimerase
MATDTDQTLKKRTVLMTGASSQIGLFTIPRLVDAGMNVMAVSRKGRPGAFPEFNQVEWLTEADALHKCSDCRYFLSAGPLNLVNRFLTTATGLKSAVVFSSSSVVSKQQSENPLEKTQVGDMRAQESGILKLAQKSGLRLVIFRPTLIYGCGLDNNVSRLANWIRQFGIMPVNGKASGLRQPVHADDLAGVAVKALLGTDELPPTMFLGGGETLSYSDMVARIFAALGKPVRLVHLPQWFFVLLVKLASAAKPGAGVNSEMVKRQLVDLVFEDRQARDLLGYNPRPFTPQAGDFSLPDFD